MRPAHGASARIRGDAGGCPGTMKADSRLEKRAGVGSRHARKSQLCLRSLRAGGEVHSWGLTPALSKGQRSSRQTSRAITPRHPPFFGHQRDMENKTEPSDQLWPEHTKHHSEHGPGELCAISKQDPAHLRPVTWEVPCPTWASAPHSSGR